VKIRLSVESYGLRSVRPRADLGLGGWRIGAGACRSHSSRLPDRGQTPSYGPDRRVGCARRSTMLSALGAVRGIRSTALGFPSPARLEAD
jgi:hypothetical protein